MATVRVTCFLPALAAGARHALSVFVSLPDRDLAAASAARPQVVAITLAPATFAVILAVALIAADVSFALAWATEVEADTAWSDLDGLRLGGGPAKKRCGHEYGEGCSSHNVELPCEILASERAGQDSVPVWRA